MKLIAYYLPQFHPIPENNEWWENGFTEWTNVAKAKPLFKGHYQPRLPADLGFYDLRVLEVRNQQADLAREHGIHGFCYYHYWFGNGKQLLERPFNEVLSSGKPDFPFMLSWANQTWKGVWFGASKGKVLIEQQYPGKEDYIAHFKHLLPAFLDSRYILIDNKPVFNIYMTLDIPDLRMFTETFRECAHNAGLKGLYLLAGNCPQDWNPIQHGFDGVVSNNFHRIVYEEKNNLIKNKSSIAGRIENRIKLILKSHNIEERSKPYIMNYQTMMDLVAKWPKLDFDYFPQVIPDWDNSARAGVKSLVLKGSTPELWAKHLQDAANYIQRYNGDRNIIFVKSWNEWAEGNYLEPDQKWGLAYMEKIKEILV